jgi:hypothetical protein
MTYPLPVHVTEGQHKNEVLPLAVCCLVYATSCETLKNFCTNICGHSVRADSSEWHFTCRATYFHAKISITRRSILVVAKICAAKFYVKLNNILFPARIFFSKSYSFERIYLHERKLSKFFRLCILLPTP